MLPTLAGLFQTVYPDPNGVFQQADITLGISVNRGLRPLALDASLSP